MDEFNCSLFIMPHIQTNLSKTSIFHYLPPVAVHWWKTNSIWTNFDIKCVNLFFFQHGQLPLDQVSLIQRLFSWPCRIHEDLQLAESRLCHKRDQKEAALKSRVAAFQETWVAWGVVTWWEVAWWVVTWYVVTWCVVTWWMVSWVVVMSGCNLSVYKCLEAFEVNNRLIS